MRTARPAPELTLAKHLARVAVCCALFAVAVLSSGCAHNVLIRTVPEGAEVTVDGVEQGPSPVVVQRTPGPFGDMTVQAELDSFTTTRRIVPRDQPFLWPLLCGMVPFFGIAALAIPPPVGIGICLGWGVLTGPSVCALGLTRRYPDEVVLELKPRLEPHSGELLPTDWWTVPQEYAPNPVPIGEEESEAPQEGAPLPDDKSGPSGVLPPGRQRY